MTDLRTIKEITDLELWLERVIKECQGKSPYANGRADQAKWTLQKLRGDAGDPDAGER